MDRYLIRLENTKHSTPQDVKQLSTSLRELLGSRDALGHLRVSSKAIEFDLFVEDRKALDLSKRKLEQHVGKTLTLKALDKAPIPGDFLEVLREGISLFNEERFWEAHEVLEQIWRSTEGEEKTILQGLIMTAAAFVHSQRNRTDQSFAMLKKAAQKLGSQDKFFTIDLQSLRGQIEETISSAKPMAFKIAL